MLYVVSYAVCSFLNLSQPENSQIQPQKTQSNPKIDREMPRKMNSFNQYEQPSKQFSDSTQPRNSKTDPRKIQKRPNIGKHEKRKMEKYLENYLFQSTGGETLQQFS